MRQTKLVVELYKACVAHDADKIARLRRKEFAKILKRKTTGKQFTHKWVLVRI
jgi:hypothetical protein